MDQKPRVTGIIKIWTAPEQSFLLETKGRLCRKCTKRRGNHFIWSLSPGITTSKKRNALPLIQIILLFKIPLWTTGRCWAKTTARRTMERNSHLILSQSPATWTLWKMTWCTFSTKVKSKVALSNHLRITSYLTEATKLKIGKPTVFQRIVSFLNLRKRNKLNKPNMFRGMILLKNSLVSQSHPKLERFRVKAVVLFKALRDSMQKKRGMKSIKDKVRIIKTIPKCMITIL